MGLGAVRAGCAALVAAALVATLAPTEPVTAAEGPPPPSSFHGTWSDNMSIVAQQGRAASEARLDDIDAAGVGLIRQYVWWDRIETSPGTFDWAVMDAVVADAAERGMTVLPTLLYPPAFYSSEPPDSTSARLFPPADPQTMARFAGEMVKRYGPLGTFWKCTRTPPLVGELKCPEPYLPFSMYEVWNEPDYPSWWKTPGPDPAEYLELLKPVHGAIKQADPTAQVVLGSLTNMGAGSEGGYLEQLYELGAAPYFDVVAVNAYGRDVGSVMAFLHGTRDVATRHQDAEVPLLITEYGWATGGTSPYYVTDEACQAALLNTVTREIVRRRTELGVIGAIQFQWHDVPADRPAWPHFAGVRRADSSEKPARAALDAAIDGQPAPGGLTPETACPADRRSLDGELQRLTVDVTGSGAGSVTSSPSGISCGATCSREFMPGQTLTLRATPAPGSRVVAWHGTDCAAVEECAVTMDTARTVAAELSSAAPTGTYQESSPALGYTGTWSTVRNSRDRAGASRRAPNGPAAVSLRFRGQGVRWISRRSRDSGRNAVYIDGNRVRVVDRYASSTAYRQRVFDSGVLPRGEHTIEIRHTGTRNRRATDDNVWLDALVVY